MGLLYGENYIILTSAVLADPPMWQTDGQTDGRTITYRGNRAKHMLSRAKKRLLYRLHIIQRTVRQTYQVTVGGGKPVSLAENVAVPCSETSQFSRLLSTTSGW